MTGEPLKRNEDGRDQIGYLKHAIHGLLSETGSMYSLGPSARPANGYPSGDTKVTEMSQGFQDLGTLFSNGVSDGIPERNREDIQAVLGETSAFLNQETFKILVSILAALRINPDQRKGPSTSFPFGSPEKHGDMLSQHHSREHKESEPIIAEQSDIFLSSEIIDKVRGEMKALAGNQKSCEEALNIFSSELLVKLCKMEHDIDEILNQVVSHCRPMTTAEKHNLGKLIRKLPSKAFDGALKIIRISNSAEAHPPRISVNLEELDDAVLWRLYYFVDMVLKCNRLH